LPIDVVLRKLGLRPRRTAVGASGGFHFETPAGSMDFLWDGAGIDADGNVVVIEEELGPIVAAHIQSHLFRLLVMAALGESIAGLVWVVPENSFERLHRIVRIWSYGQERVSVSPLPLMRYFDAEGYEIHQRRRPTRAVPRLTKPIGREESAKEMPQGFGP
jgi:hypothetical protein